MTYIFKKIFFLIFLSRACEKKAVKENEISCKQKLCFFEFFFPRARNCTNISNISQLVALYVYLIKNKFIFNILSEIYHLIYLLTAKQFKDDDSNEEVHKISKFENKNDLATLFQSFHNQIYFSLESLQNLTENLRIFDKSTLNLLLNNQRLQHFSKEKYTSIKTDLKELINEKQVETFNVTSNSNTAGIRNVNFSSETDNRDNFICDGSFHAFRKQRDLFYDILKTWEDKRKNPDWNFQTALNYKVKALLNLCNDPVNFRQFAKLFKSQLLLICHKDDEDDLYMQNEEVILQHFPTMDSSKLNKLKLRLLSKPENVGLDASPIFPGYQEFFRDFILACTNSSFLEHLKDVFLAETLSENEYMFTGYDLNHRENSLKNQAVQSVNEKLTKLLVLAKFLAFLESLPFQNDFRKMSKKIVQNQIDARCHYRGLFDVKQILLTAIEKERIVFTTSWIVIYLSMLDYVTLRLPYFEEVVEILFSLYKNIDSVSDSYTRLLLITSLNWLFGLPHFPNESYYNFLKKPFGTFIIDNEYFKDISDGYFVEILNGKVQNNFPIDKLNLVTENMLYVCCPSLETFKSLLSSTINKQGPITKHITPLTKVEFQKTKEQVQKQLEEAFLNTQPHTIRKIIEFSTEKITSGCIQHLTTQLVQIKKNIALELLNKVKINSIAQESTGESLDKKYSTQVSNEISNILQTIKMTCLEVSNRIISEKTEFAMKGLMSVEELPATIQKCADISTRICQEKIKMWLDMTVTASTIEKRIIQEGRKIMNKPAGKVTSNIPSGGKNVQHSENTFSAVKILDKLRSLMINVMEDGNVTEEDVQAILDDSKDTIENRCDVNDNIMLTIHKLTLELCVVLISVKADLASGLLGSFQEFWVHFKPSMNVFKHVVSVRNIHMLSMSKNRKESWDVFMQLLVIINKNSLVTFEDFEEQCLSVFKQSWDEETLSEICNCYSYLIESLKDKNLSFAHLLSFMSGYCLDLNNF